MGVNDNGTIRALLSLLNSTMAGVGEEWFAEVCSVSDMNREKGVERRVQLWLIQEESPTWDSLTDDTTKWNIIRGERA